MERPPDVAEYILLSELKAMSATVIWEVKHRQLKKFDCDFAVLKLMIKINNTKMIFADFISYPF
jgi:hypothetical protein